MKYMTLLDLFTNTYLVIGKDYLYGDCKINLPNEQIFIEQKKFDDILLNKVCKILRYTIYGGRYIFYNKKVKTIGNIYHDKNKWGELFFINDFAYNFIPSAELHGILITHPNPKREIGSILSYFFTPKEDDNYRPVYLNIFNEYYKKINKQDNKMHEIEDFIDKILVPNED